MDDILVFSKNLNEHFYDVKSVINMLINKSLKASGYKSYLITSKFLGQIISDGIVRAHPKRAECIANMPRPKHCSTAIRYKKAKKI